MTTSGLVVTLADDPELASEAVTTALLVGPFTPGDLVGHRLALALEADDSDQAREWHDWLARLPGVVKVDVAFVHSDPPAEEPTHDR